MGLWNLYKAYVKKKTKNNDPNDVTFLEAKGKITRKAIEQELKDIADATFTDIKIGKHQGLLVYLTSMADKSLLQKFVFEPVYKYGGDELTESFKYSTSHKSDELPKLIANVMNGFTAILVFDKNLFWTVNTFNVPQRGIQSNQNEATVIGPQDSFTESLETNLSLIKRRIASPQLKHKQFLIGTESRTPVAVLYMDNIANSENVARVVMRLKNIEYDALISNAELKQMFYDKPYSPFPQYHLTQRPDSTVSSIIEGKIIVLVNGSPDATIMPSTFLEMFFSAEDYYNSSPTATLLRFIRIFGFIITILLTSTYVSVLTYHPEMLPPVMLTLLAESRTKVPFPPLIEVLMMELVIEILREAGARMPQKIGQTIGIVGGIVIGTAAVEAGLASNVLIVIVAISALLSFLPPNFHMSNAIRLLRYVFIIAAGFLGMYGQMLALAWLFAHLLSLTSLGTPYMSPIIPRKWTDLKDSLLRAPMNYMFTRPGVSRAKKGLRRPLDEE